MALSINSEGTVSLTVSTDLAVIKSTDTVLLSNKIPGYKLSDLQATDNNIDINQISKYKGINFIQSSARTNDALYKSDSQLEQIWSIS